jgi:hypothetical protein
MEKRENEWEVVLVGKERGSEGRKKRCMTRRSHRG